MPNIKGNQINTGTGANQIVQMDANGRMPNAVLIIESKVSYGTTGAVAIDTSISKFFYPTGTTTGVITFSFTNPDITNATSFTMIGQGWANNAPVWPASVEWPGGAEPIWSTGKDMVSFMSYDGGITWLGMLGGLAFA